MNYGKTIKAERERTGESLAVYAKRLGITKAGLWKLERGKSIPTQKTLSMFAKVSGRCMAQIVLSSLEDGDFLQ